MRLRHPGVLCPRQPHTTTAEASCRYVADSPPGSPVRTCCCSNNIEPNVCICRELARACCRSSSSNGPLHPCAATAALHLSMHAAAHLAAVLCAAAASGLVSVQCSTSSSPGVVWKQASCTGVRPHHGNRHWSEPRPWSGGGSAGRVSGSDGMHGLGKYCNVLVLHCTVLHGQPIAYKRG